MGSTFDIKVSVIVPVYNAEPYISQCLDSLVHQTLQDIEIILINDCSTDRSGEICDEYAVRDERIQVIHNKRNLRQGLCRNMGIENAKGEYLGFVDADDWIDHNYYEKLYQEAATERYDVVKTNPVKVLTNGRHTLNTHLQRRIRKGLKAGYPLAFMLTHEHTTAIYRAALVKNNHIRYPDIRNAQDDVFLLRFSLIARSIKLVPAPHYYYRQHEHSTIHVQHKPYFDSILQCFNLQMDEINQAQLDKTAYDLIFSRILAAVRNRYPLIDQLPDSQSYKREYFEQAMKIIQRYRFDPGEIMDRLSTGFLRQKELADFEQGVLFRVAGYIHSTFGKLKHQILPALL